MNDQTEFDKNLKELRKNAIIEVSDWGGLGENAGNSGIIVTRDRSIYQYRCYYKKSEGEKTDRIYKDKDLTKEEFNKIKKFIRNEIVIKKLNSEMMLDCGSMVRIKYKWITKKIENNREIYAKAKEILTPLLLSDTERKKVNEEEFNRDLNEIRKDAVIEVSDWGESGENGIIITEDKSIYTYKHYYDFMNSEANFIDKKDLEADKFDKITKFIEDEIVNKELESVMMPDSGFKVVTNYKGITKEIENNEEIYYKTKKMINILLLSSPESRMSNQTKSYKMFEGGRRDAVIELSTWGGLGENARNSGIIVTNSKNIYTYECYYNLMKSEVEEDGSFDIKDLGEDEFSRITKFIEDEIVNKEFENTAMLDSVFKITINYKGITKEIENNKEIYDKTKEVINSLLLSNTERKMKEQTEFNKNLDELRKNAVIEVGNWDEAGVSARVWRSHCNK